jgi:DNA-binding FrmR family transcriptional regulator
MNRLVWDYRLEKPVKVESGSRGSREESLEAVGGPRAIPGDYQVRLSVGSESFVERFSLSPDPRLAVSSEDLRAQFDLKLAIRDRTSEANTAINRIRRLRAQVESWEKRAGDRASVKDAARSLNEQLKAVEAELINVEFEKPRPGLNRIKEKLDALSSMIDESDDKPTRGAYEVYEMLRDQVSDQLQRLQTLLDGPVRSFNDLIRAEAIPSVGD